MKNRIKVLLISIALMALPAYSFAKVLSGSTVASPTISSKPVSTGASTGPGSVTPASRCTNSSVSNVEFAFNTTTNPTTYSFSYTCTLTVNGTTQAVVSTNHDGSGSCEPSESEAACKNVAMGNAEMNCASLCTSSR
jgi:hypothetical protein